MMVDPDSGRQEIMKFSIKFFRWLLFHKTICAVSLFS